MNNKITSRNKDFGQWYTDIILNAKLMEYGPIMGTMIIRPNGWKIWELIKEKVDKEFKECDVQNVSMPLLFPLSIFNKEKEHMQGFNPELFLVQQIGEQKLQDPYVIRPTSEVIFSLHFSNILRSYKDLPIIYNQWCNILRAEKTTRPFLRTSEFHWQEGHTIHETPNEAMEYTKKIHSVYAKIINVFLCIPTIAGEKTENEKFAGALNTYTLESQMQDGKALQCATTHYFGQNFSKIYNIKFQNKNNTMEYAYQTSWGISTRIIGALIMQHSDDNGLILPPDIAPIQIILLSVLANKEPKVIDKINEIEKKLNKIYRVSKDINDKSIGFKLTEQEIIGTPIRIEIGPNDLKNNSVNVSTRIDSKKVTVNEKDLEIYIEEQIKDIKHKIYQKAKDNLLKRIHYVYNYNDFKKELKQNIFVIAPFAGTAEDEQKIKRETFATARCIPFEQPINNSNKELKCFYTGKKAQKFVIFALAY